MSVRIANNVSMINAHGNMKKVYNKMQKNCEKLSSGFRINRAADDAAGLSISEKMRAQINGLSQASDNISYGINYAQVADGALQEVQNIFLRIRELSVQSSNDTCQSEDRQAIEEEIKQLKQEVSQIFNNTEYNNMKIWVQNTNVVVGREMTEAVMANVPGTTYLLDNNNKYSVPADNTYTLEADENGIVVSWKAYNGNEYKSNTISWPADITGNHSFKLSDHLDITSNPELQGIDFTYSYNVSKYAKLEDVIESINGKKLHNSNYSSFDTQLFVKDSSLGGISFSASINYTAMLASGKDFDNYDTDFIEKSVENNLIQYPTESESDKSWQFEFDVPGIGKVKAESYSMDYRSHWKDPDKKWWGEQIYNGTKYEYTKIYTPVPNRGDLDSVIYSLNNDNKVSLLKDTNGIGGYIEVNFRLTSESDYQSNPGDPKTYKDVGIVTMRISVGASDTVETIKEKLANIEGLDIYAGIQGNNSPRNAYTYISSYSPNGIEIEGDPIYEKKEEINLKIQAGANQGETISIDYEALTNSKVGIDSISVLTREDANNSISAIDEAIQIISGQRSTFGALQNRMEHAKNNVDNTHINTVASESRIRDIDMAKEMALYIKEQILMQANQSLMPQMNIRSENVLALLK